MSDDELRLCDALEQACELQSDADFDAYEHAIEALKGRFDPGILRRLLRCLRDVEAGEIQYELVEACELFPDDIYVPVFLSEGIEVQERSPQWFQLMFQSVLNTPACVESFVMLFPTLPAKKRQRYLELIKPLAAEEPKYQRILERVGA